MKLKTLSLIFISLAFCRLSFASECPIWYPDKAQGKNGVLISFADERSAHKNEEQPFPTPEYKKNVHRDADSTLKKLIPQLPENVQSAICNSNLRIEFYYGNGGGRATVGFDKYGKLERVIKMGTVVLYDGHPWAEYLRGKEKVLIGFPDGTADPSIYIPRISFSSNSLNNFELHFYYIFLHEFGHQLIYEQRLDTTPKTCTTSCQQVIKSLGGLGQTWKKLLSGKEYQKNCFAFNGPWPNIGSCSTSLQVNNLYQNLYRLGFPSLYSAYSFQEFTAELFVHYLFHKLNLARIFYEVKHIPQNMSSELCASSNHRAGGTSKTCQSISIWNDTNQFSHLQSAIDFLKQRLIVISE